MSFIISHYFVYTPTTTEKLLALPIMSSLPAPHSLLWKIVGLEVLSLETTKHLVLKAGSLKSCYHTKRSMQLLHTIGPCPSSSFNFWFYSMIFFFPKQVILVSSLHGPEVSFTREVFSLPVQLPGNIIPSKLQCKTSLSTESISWSFTQGRKHPALL